MLRLVLIAMAASLALAAPAPAQTAIFKDDAEGDIATLWQVDKPKTEAIQEWQKSDSATAKSPAQGSSHEGTGYWTGSSPNDFQPTEVVTGESIMTTKAPFVVPADGVTELSFWWTYINEGDDEGLTQVAIVDESGAVGKFTNVNKIQAVNVAAGEQDTRTCDPSNPATFSQSMTEQKVKLGAYAGRRIMLRFNMKYGTENRPLSQPCGWWIDDIVVNTTGTPGNAAPAGGGTTTPSTAPPAAQPAPAPQLRFGRMKAKGKRASLGLTLDNGPLTGVTVRLFDRRGRKLLGTAKVATLRNGASTVRIKTKTRLKIGRKTVYVLRVAGRAPDGKAFTASGKAPAVK